jgi:hypothetical protein
MAAITQDIIDGVDHVIHENGNAYISLRRVSWNDAEPKMDLRRYVTKPDGSEQIMKGITFDDKAATELTHALLEEGYGDTRTCLEIMKNRDNFMPSLSWALEAGDKDRLKDIFPDMEWPNMEDDKEEFYDIREDLAI